MLKSLALFSALSVWGQLALASSQGNLLTADPQNNYRLRVSSGLSQKYAGPVGAVTAHYNAETKHYRIRESDYYQILLMHSDRGVDSSVSGVRLWGANNDRSSLWTCFVSDCLASSLPIFITENDAVDGREYQPNDIALLNDLLQGTSSTSKQDAMERRFSGEIDLFCKLHDMVPQPYDDWKVAPILEEVYQDESLYYFGTFFDQLKPLVKKLSKISAFTKKLRVRANRIKEGSQLLQKLSRCLTPQEMEWVSQACDEKYCIGIPQVLHIASRLLDADKHKLGLERRKIVRLLGVKGQLISPIAEINRSIMAQLLLDAMEQVNQ